MNEQAILHIPESGYCFAQSDRELVLRLRLDRRDEVGRVEILLECKYRFQEKQSCYLMEKKYEDRLFAFYESTIQLSDVRSAYVFRIRQGEDIWYFSEDGLTKEYNFSLGYFNFFQLPYINEIDLHREVKWMRTAVFYQIFVDRFYRGIEEKDERYINLQWGEKPLPKSFAGGDIPGITQKLDYIKGLGANTLYLTPVFESISNHKYDISDYYTVDEQFGKNEDLKELVDQAHKKGMRIVLDAVFNHCSDRMKQFQDVLQKGNQSAYHDWFLIRGDKPDQDAVNYEVFSFCNYMPKLNTSNPEVQEFLAEIAVHWIREYDIDGWRLDVSDEVSHDFWRLFRKRVKAAKEDCVIIGENWHDANMFLRGDQYDSIMNYAFTKACLDYYAFGTFQAEQFAWKLNGLLMRNTKTVNRMMLNLLDTHDTDRFYTSVGNNKNRLLSALAVTCMFEGVPCVYYGTEIPTEGGYDPDNRRCFEWDESQWDEEFRVQLKTLLSLRKHPAIQSGEIRINSRDGLFCLRRFFPTGAYSGSGCAEVESAKAASAAGESAKAASAAAESAGAVSAAAGENAEAASTAAEERAGAVSAAAGESAKAASTAGERAGAGYAAAGESAKAASTAGENAGAEYAAAWAQASSPAEEWTLWTNQTGKALPLSAEGTIFAQNRYHDGLLETDGYVIIKNTNG